MSLVQIKFDGNNQCFLCCYDNLNLKKDVNVIVDTPNNGLMFGKVVSLVCNSDFEDEACLAKVVRLAYKKDYLQYLSNVKDAENAVVVCKKMAKDERLNMNIIDGYYNFDKSQLMFRFVADERIDFRKLARDLGAVFKTRIELRQIGIRDKAKEIGGFGPCGRMLCCNTFLRNFDSVSISMAKNQALSLNPTKINGVCGRLLCCLKYENDMYTELKSVMPSVGSVVTVSNEKGKVIYVNPFNQKYRVMMSDKSVIEVDNNGSEE